MTRERLRQFIGADLGVEIAAYGDDARLFSEGVLDSFHLLEIIALFENETGLRVGASEVSLSNFDSINRMLAYLEHKVGRV